MRKVKSLLLILCMTLFVSCADTDIESVRCLEKGMTQQEVVNTLGEPGTIWVRDGVDRWFYELGGCTMVCVNFNAHGHLKEYYCYNGCSDW